MSVPFVRSALVFALMAGCGIETDKVSPIDDTSGGGGDCERPLANAGADQTVSLGTTVTVDGSGSTVCRTEDRAYTWTFEAVPTDSAIDETALSDNESATAIAVAFTPDVPGDYVLSLKVSDGEHNSASDLVVITVTSEDAPPVADCGDNKAGTVSVRTVMDGSGSYDPEGATLDYAWSLSSVPDCSDVSTSDLYDGSTATPSVVPDCDGIYVLSLVVSDGYQWSEPDLCYIDVASENRLPVADAGDSGELPPCIDNTIELNGYGSYDLDGDSLSYLWSLVGAPGGSAASDDDFADATDPTTTFRLPDDPAVEGDYTFQLQVYDGNEWSAPDIVIYTVLGEGLNTPPVANAGDDQSVETEAECEVGLSYSATCEDCEAVTLELDGTSSTDADGDALSFLWSETTNTLDIGIPRASMTNVTIPAVTAEYRSDITATYEVLLTVSDACDATGSDKMTITYTCTGKKGSTSF